MNGTAPGFRVAYNVFKNVLGEETEDQFYQIEYFNGKEWQPIAGSRWLATFGQTRSRHTLATVMADHPIYTKVFSACPEAAVDIFSNPNHEQIFRQDPLFRIREVRKGGGIDYEVTRHSADARTFSEEEIGFLEQELKYQIHRRESYARIEPIEEAGQ